MDAPKRRPKFTVEQYLALERPSEERHVYLDGDIWAMGSESWDHGTITVNLVGVVAIQLRSTPYHALSKEIRVYSGPNPRVGGVARGMYCYPDLLVIGKPEYQDEFKDSFLNPIAIIECLSPKTEAFDRGEKFIRFQTWNPSVTDYVLVSQDQPQVEHFSRRDDGSWLYRRYEGLDSSFSIPSIGCTLKLAEVYERVVFAQE